MRSRGDLASSLTLLLSSSFSLGVGGGRLCLCQGAGSRKITIIIEDPVAGWQCSSSVLPSLSYPTLPHLWFSFLFSCMVMSCPPLPPHLTLALSGLRQDVGLSSLSLPCVYHLECDWILFGEIVFPFFFRQANATQDLVPFWFHVFFMFVFYCHA